MTRTTWGWGGDGVSDGNSIVESFWNWRPSFSDSRANIWYWYRFSAQTDNIEILLGRGMDVVKEYLFGFRDHDFWISRQVLPTGTNFRGDLTTMKFWGVGHGRGRGVHFHGLRPLFSDSPFNFCGWYQFSSQSDEIEILLGWGVGVVISYNFWVSGPWFSIFSSIFTYWYQFSGQSDDNEILRGGAWVWSKHKFRIVPGNSGKF